MPNNRKRTRTVNNETYSEYKDLAQNEMIFIRKNQDRIMGNAKLLYKQKLSNDQTTGYVKSALDYATLEKFCDEYKKVVEENKS